MSASTARYRGRRTQATMQRRQNSRIAPGDAAKLRVWDNGKGLKGRLTAFAVLTCKPGGYSAMPPPVRRSPCDAEGKGITAALRLHVAFITMCNYMRVTSGPRYPYVCYCMSICPRSQQSLKPQSTGVPSPLSALVPAPRRRVIRGAYRTTL